jgi:hypothetical protein
MSDHSASSGGSIRVDTTAMESAGRALAAAARLAFDARRTADTATSGAGWAVQTPLPIGLGEFASVLDGALGRLVDDARDAAAQLALAGARYQDADRAAVQLTARS